MDSISITIRLDLSIPYCELFLLSVIFQSELLTNILSLDLYISPGVRLQSNIIRASVGSGKSEGNIVDMDMSIRFDVLPVRNHNICMFWSLALQSIDIPIRTVLS